LSPDCKLVALAAADGIHLLESATARDSGRTLATHGDYGFALAFSPDGAILAYAGEHGSGGVVRLWDLASRRPLGPPQVRDNEVGDVAFSPDGRTLATADGDGLVRLWDIRRRRPIGRPLDAGGDAVFAVEYSPDGTMLASADERGSAETIHLWNAHTQHAVGPPLKGHTSRVLDLSFSRDSSTLASIDERGLIRLWDSRNHRLLGRPIKGHAFGSSLAFSPDGKQLISAGAKPAMRAWNAVLWSNSDRAVRSWVCAAVGHDLSRSEWHAFLPGEAYRRTCPPPRSG
jgi:WD40 repeat protein